MVSTVTPKRSGVAATTSIELRRNARAPALLPAVQKNLRRGNQFLRRSCVQFSRLIAQLGMLGDQAKAWPDPQEAQVVAALTLRREAIRNRGNYARIYNANKLVAGVRPTRSRIVALCFYRGFGNWPSLYRLDYYCSLGKRPASLCQRTSVQRSGRVAWRSRNSGRLNGVA